MTSAPEVSADRLIVVTRVFDAPRALVFAAWTDPAQVGRWFGPRGFTTTTGHLDLRPGGEWRFTFHGPDGASYPNLITYREIAPPARLVYSHGAGLPNDPNQFEVTVTFAEQGQQTALTMRMVFRSAAAREHVVTRYHAIQGAHETLDRLAEHLTHPSAPTTGDTMRKAILFMMTSVNGYFEAPNHDIDWHTVDEEFNDFAVTQTSSAGALLFGRVTYELMASYWPTQQALDNDPAITQVMNRLPKVVFSRTLDQADWVNTRLVKTDAAAEVTRLKQEPGDDIFILGSSALTASLAAAGVVDEFRLMLSPLLLAQGTPLLQGLPANVKLKLINTRTFGNGNVLLTYQPA